MTNKEMAAGRFAGNLGFFLYFLHKLARMMPEGHPGPRTSSNSHIAQGSSGYTLRSPTSIPEVLHCILRDNIGNTQP